MRSPGLKGSGNVTVTARSFVATTSRGLPLIRRTSASGLPTLGSYTAANEKATSAEVKGAPSEKRTFGRRSSSYDAPSVEPRQLSASHGSTRSSTLLMRTRGAWVSSETRPEAESVATNRLKVRGSDRTDATSPPPHPDPPKPSVAEGPVQPRTALAIPEAITRNKTFVFNVLYR